MKCRHVVSSGKNMVLLLGMLGVLCMGCSREHPEASPVDPAAAAYLLQVEEALQQGAYEQALAYADSAGRRAPETAVVHVLRGRVYTEMGMLEAADAAYRQALALDPAHPGLRERLGDNAYNRRAYPEAIRHYRAALRTTPSPLSWRGIGRVYLQQAAFDSAQYAFEAALAADSTYAPAHFSLSTLYETEGDLARALQHARRAWALAPEDDDFKYGMAELMVKTGHDEEALPHLLDVAERRPWHYPAHYNLSRALAHLGQMDLADVALQKAERLRALDMEIYQWQNATREAPEDAFSHAALGTAFRVAGRYEEALRAYRTAVHLDPSNLDVQNNIASLHLLREDTLAAVRQYQSVLQQDSTLADVWTNLGVVYAISGEQAAARRAWAAALRQDPDHVRAKAYLVRAK